MKNIDTHKHIKFWPVPQRNDRASNFNQLTFLKAADLKNILEND